MVAMTLVSTQIAGVARWAGWGGPVGWFWWPLIPLFWFGLWTLIIFATWHWWGPRQTANRMARTILAERYARGEIDVDEYRRRVKGLS